MTNAGQRETWEVYSDKHMQKLLCVFECQSPDGHGLADWRATISERVALPGGCWGKGGGGPAGGHVYGPVRK